MTVPNDPVVEEPRRAPAGPWRQVTVLLVFEAIWLITCGVVFGLLVLGAAPRSLPTTWIAAGLIVAVFVGCLWARTSQMKDSTDRLLAGISTAIGVVAASLVLLLAPNTATDVRFRLVEDEATSVAQQLLLESDDWPEGHRCPHAISELGVDMFAGLTSVCPLGNESSPVLRFDDGTDDGFVYAPEFSDDGRGPTPRIPGTCVRQMTDDWWIVADDTDASGCPLGFTSIPSGP